MSEHGSTAAQIEEPRPLDQTPRDSHCDLLASALGEAGAKDRRGEAVSS